MDQWDETVYGEEEAEEEEFEASHEQMVFLIDASHAMLEPCDVRKQRVRERNADGTDGEDGGGGEEEADEEFEGLSWLGAAVRVAQKVMKSKIISANNDEVAVVLYNTRESVVQADIGDFPNAYLLHAMDPPSAESIAKLDAFHMDFFQRTIGTAGPDVSKATPLKSALWMAATMFQPGKNRKASASHRLLLFTRDEEPFKRYDRGTDPTPSWRMIEGHLKELGRAHAALELYPMLGPSDPPFDLQPFWRAVLVQLRGGGSEVEDQMEEWEQVMKIGDLTRFVRSKAHRKRALCSIQWRLGPREEDLCVAVKLYQMLQKQGIPPLRRVDGKNAVEVKSQVAQVNEYTGAQVQQGEIQYFYPHPKMGKGLPKTHFTLEELCTIKGHNQAGMSLLGFKPASCLKDHHQVRNSSFMYPDDKKQPGSATAFVALHTAMMKTDTIAICRLAANKARTPQLVALLPAQEVEFDDGSQAEPPGFHAIYLPYCDDLRSPETDPAFTGAERLRPSDEAVASGEELVAALRMPAFSSSQVSNPWLQRHYEVLESKALDEEPRDVEEARADDDSQPRIYEDEDVDPEQPTGRTLGDVIQAFADLVGVNEDEAKQPEKRKPAVADPAAVEALGIEDKAQQGAAALKALTNDSLKAWLRANGCPVSGKKDELVARIMNKLGL